MTEFKKWEIEYAKIKAYNNFDTQNNGTCSIAEDTALYYELLSCIGEAAKIGFKIGRGGLSKRMAYMTREEVMAEPRKAYEQGLKAGLAKALDIVDNADTKDDASSLIYQEIECGGENG